MSFLVFLEGFFFTVKVDNFVAAVFFCFGGPQGCTKFRPNKSQVAKTNSPKTSQPNPGFNSHYQGVTFFHQLLVGWLVGVKGG